MYCFVPNSTLVTHQSGGVREGEEPEISFPVVDTVLHEFVDAKYKTKEQHEKGREARPPLRVETDALLPWTHTASLNPRRIYMVLQIFNPHYDPLPPTLDAEEKEIEGYANHFITALIQTTKDGHTNDDCRRCFKRGDMKHLSKCSSVQVGLAFCVV